MASPSHSLPQPTLYSSVAEWRTNVNSLSHEPTKISAVLINTLTQRFPRKSTKVEFIPLILFEECIFFLSLSSFYVIPGQTFGKIKAQRGGVPSAAGLSVFPETKIVLDESKDLCICC